MCTQPITDITEAEEMCYQIIGLLQGTRAIFAAMEYEDGAHEIHYSRLICIGIDKVEAVLTFIYEQKGLAKKEREAAR